MTSGLFDDDAQPNHREPDPASDTAPGPQLIRVWSRGKFTTACRSCGAPMTMAQVVASGKWMPFDADPVALKTSQDTTTGRLVEHLDPADVHFRSCPKASEHRRPR